MRDTKPKKKLLRTGVLPSDVNSENALLSGLVQDSEAMGEVLKLKLSVEDFFEPKNRLIFETLINFFHKGEAWDINRVLSAMEASGTLAQAGGIDFLADLLRIQAGAANIKHYAKTIKDKSIYRQLLRAGGSISEIVDRYNQDITSEPTGALNEASKLFYDLSEGNTASELKPVRETIGTVFETLREIYEHKGDPNWVNSGFIDLDDKVNGLQNESFIILAGRPGGGKSALGLAIAQNVASEKGADGRNKTVAFFSLEMPASQLIYRIMAKYSGIDSRKFVRASLNDGEWQQLSYSLADISALNLFIDESAQPTVAEIYAKCQRIKQKHGLHLVVLDYIQLMAEKDNSYTPREQVVADISRRLKKMAKDLKVPVIGLAQLNRESVKGEKKARPKASELRESGALEQDADVILLLYEDEEKIGAGKIEIIIDKNRMGEKGRITLSYNKALSRFDNLAGGGFYS